MSHVATRGVQDIWFKTQRVIRTIIAAAIVLVPTANLLLPALAEAFNAPGVPEGVYLWVNVAVGAILVVLGIVTRIMAIPVVNAWLTKFGAGSVPKSEVG